MSQRSKDRILDSFAAITGCSRDEARGYLQAVDWNKQAAVSIFFDNASAQQSPPKPSTKAQAKGTRPAHEPDPYDSDEDLLQQALAESLRLNQAASPPAPPPVRTRAQPAHPTSKLSTVDDFRRHAKATDHEGETYYAGGSDRSGQQFIAPPKPRGDQKGVEGVFDAARRLGATEVRDNEPRASSTQAKQEKPFTGTGRSLNRENGPPRADNAPRPRVANDEIQLIPIRFYSDGFTVGDGELRRVEENHEFIESVKRGELPPELRQLSKNGRQVQVRLEDHSKEEYKRVVPEFQSFSGVGHAVGLPGAPRTTQASGSATIPESLDVNRLQELAAKRLRTSSTSSTTIRLRLPDISTPLSIPIDLNRTLADIRKFLNENVPSLQANSFEFMQPPSTRISREEERRKINDAQLANSALIVRRTA